MAVLNKHTSQFKPRSVSAEHIRHFRVVIWERVLVNDKKSYVRNSTLLTCDGALSLIHTSDNVEATLST